MESDDGVDERRLMSGGGFTPKHAFFAKLMKMENQSISDTGG